ncbi:zinc ribbon domain-containing protein [Ruminococcus sp.]|uniref:zinc ribbon domain-containing protein n=1 Tax=Ruminococcus sp. TaxID=41978 RepID=UPI0039A00C58
MTFCKNCGAKLNPQDEFCPNCGTKNETPQQPQQPDGMGADAVTAVPGGKKPFLGMNTKGLLIAAGCIVVTAVLVIVLLCSFFGSSSKSVVKDYYKAIENCDAKDLMATVPKDYLKELTNDVQDYLDKYYDEYDDIKVTFEDKEKLDKNDFADYFDFEDASDLEVKKGVKYELKVRYRSDEKKDNESEDFIVFQYKGKWYSMDAMFLVAMATYF